MQFMIIEHFRPDKIREMYERFDRHGRMLPEGVAFVNSYINEDVTICYQVMEATNIAQLQTWIDKWKDVTDFEVIAVISSAKAKAKVFSR